ncbi:interferon alpha-10-like isoform X2 [Clarias gariepinus]|uniref:interferon alpha-10-like isoform X2 n=1 Tax=Clarias gariepinus TaxID=13013 RepID=UPI00234E1F31|nr:interferon alpha-10-like isoform X2 [Clarias gariepinus]
MTVGGRMPQECLNEKIISFPKDVFIKAQNEDMLMVALETLKGVNKIFKNEQTSVTWEKNDLSLFTNIVHRQVKSLRDCVGEEAETDKPADGSAATLRSYFETLEKRLKEREFSLCSWEMVRTELQDGLKKFQTFLESKK